MNTFDDLGNSPVTSANDANIPVAIDLEVRDGRWVLKASNYMPRKGRVEEDHYHVEADNREVLVGLIHQHWLPLYQRAVEILTQMKPDRRGNASLYYWE